MHHVTAKTPTASTELVACKQSAVALPRPEVHVIVEALSKAVEAWNERGSLGHHSRGNIGSGGSYRIERREFEGEFLHVVDLRSEDMGFFVTRYGRGTPTDIETLNFDELGNLLERKTTAGAKPISIEDLHSLLLSPDLKRVG